MSLIAAKILVGFVVGILIGMSGVGGGVLLLPVLIFGLRVPRYRGGRFRRALQLLHQNSGRPLAPEERARCGARSCSRWQSGSIPGSICGVKLLMHIRHLYGDGVNSFIKTAVGVLLIVIPTLLLFQRKIEERIANRPPTMKSFMGMAVIGLVAGFLVGMTSVGSGSIIMMLLLLFYSYPAQGECRHRHCARRHAHRRHRASALPAGQCRFQPGRLAADWFHPRRAARFALGTRVPMLWLRRILCALLLITGARMLWA